jgi:hypothetical protein
MTSKGKGQIWSLDFVTSFVIFFLVLISLFFVWSYANTQNVERRMLDNLEISALSISDSLIRTPGIPKGWNPSNVERIGLASEENVLNVTKIENLISMNYDQIKSILTKYDFHLKITDINGTVYLDKGISLANKTSVPIERYCSYNGRIVKLELTLFSD